MSPPTAPCDVTMKSLRDPDHTHTCKGDHYNKDHFCPSCRTWWGKGK